MKHTGASKPPTATATVISNARLGARQVSISIVLPNTLGSPWKRCCQKE
jgi:hypothetical protein